MMVTIWILEETEMSVAMPDEVKRKTTKCSHAFSCLNTGFCGHAPHCKVLGAFDANMLYAEPANDKEVIACSYKMTCGSQGYICTCPVYYALYLQGIRKKNAA